VGGKLNAAPFVQIRNADGTLRLSFTPYPAATALKEVRLATGDVNDDGSRYLCHSGPGGSSLVKLFDGAMAHYCDPSRRLPLHSRLALRSPRAMSMAMASLMSLWERIKAQARWCVCSMAPMLN